jgi:hypothetical protein
MLERGQISPLFTPQTSLPHKRHCHTNIIATQTSLPHKSHCHTNIIAVFLTGLPVLLMQ